MAPGRDTARTVGAARTAAAIFARPIRARAALQLLTSFGPFLAACVAMHLVYPSSPLIALALAVPTGALLGLDFFQKSLPVEDGVLAEIVKPYAIIDELPAILVGGTDEHFQTALSRRPGHGSDEVIGLVSLQA